MPPLNNIETWGRCSEAGEPIEPRRRLYLLCEGTHTERRYFAALVTQLNRRGLPRYLAVCRCDKTGRDEGSSHPTSLLELAKSVIGEDSFAAGDEVAIVFDADVYNDNARGYGELLNRCGELRVSPYVTYPSFELFLLLHLDDGYDRWIAPNEREILKNRKEGKRRYLDRLFSKATGMNPKKNSRIGDLALKYPCACEQERNLNQDVRSAVGKLTSNVGLLIEHLLES